MFATIANAQEQTQQNSNNNNKQKHSACLSLKFARVVRTISPQRIPMACHPTTDNDRLFNYFPPVIDCK